MTNKYRQLRELGYQNVLPIIPPGVEISETSILFKLVGKKNDPRGKAPGVKSGVKWRGLTEWQTIVANDSQTDAWTAMGAGVGLRCGAGLIAIDIDATDLATADQIEADALAAFGPSPQRVGRWPKRALFYRITEDITYRFVLFEGGEGPEKIEVAALGRQIVVSGPHPKTGQPYKWPRPLIPFADLTIVTPAQVAQFLAEQEAKLPKAQIIVQNTGADRPVDQSKLRAKDPELFARAVRALPNNRNIYPSREDYIRVGASIKAALPDDDALAFELWTEWAAKDEGGEPDLWVKDWAGLGNKQSLSADWLYKQAAKHALDGSFGMELVMLDVIEDTPEEIAENLSKSKKYQFLDFSEVAAGGLTTSPALIKGLLDQGAMSVLYGDSNVGKTFVAMDIGFHIGASIRYAGLRTNGGLVVYVAAEGGNGAKKRLVALRERFPKANPAFKLLASPVDLRNPKADTVPLAEAIRALGQPVALLVIDTLSRAMAGGDENSSVDMGALVKHFDVLRKACAPAHLMIVHHTGKDRAKGARGHSLLRAATDTELEVAEGVITATKQRDMDKAWSSGFKLRVHKLGLDSDGDPITSCTVDLVTVGEARALAAVPTEKERIVLQAVATLDGDGSGVTTAAIEAHCADNVSDMASDAVRYHLRSLVAKRLLRKPKRGFWALEVEETVSSTSENPFDDLSEVEGSGGKVAGDIFH